jgi:oligoribonuclease NrnB/cAMP/cGMP phosphodiesterase (DHH superfamily)
MGSDAAAKLAVGWPFAAYYWDSPTGREFGLRSAPDGLDVSVIARKFGGGGHKHAAGFKLT